MRDIEELPTLLKELLTADEHDVGDYMNELCDMVKEYENEACLTPVEEIMPQLAKFHYYDDIDNTDGCTLSIFRRVRLNEETIETLIQLYNDKPDAGILHSLGHLDREFWSPRIEQIFVEALSVDSDLLSSAVRALYVHSKDISQKSTIDALVHTVLSADFLEASSAMSTLCCLVRPPFITYTTAELQALITMLDERLKKDMVEALGWATTHGLPILLQTAEDSSAEIREATAVALGRSYTQYPEAIEALLTLKHELWSDEVRAAARDALKKASQKED